MMDTFSVGQELPLVATALVLEGEFNYEGLTVRGTLRHPDGTERDLGIRYFVRVTRDDGDIFQATFGTFTPTMSGEYVFRTVSDSGIRDTVFMVVEADHATPSAS